MKEIVSGDELVAGFWSDLKKGVKKVGGAAKTVGRAGYQAGKAGYKAGKAGYGVATKVAKVASPYLPAAAAALTAIKLVRAARKGNPSAIKRIVQMNEAAEQGNPEAQQAVAVVKAVAPLPQAQESYESGPKEEQATQEAQAECEGVECCAPSDEEAQYDEKSCQDGSVSGWLFNKGYRNNVQAAELDRKNPFHAMRALYAKGMGKSTGTAKDALNLGKKLLGL